MPRPRRPPPLERAHARPRTAPAPGTAAVEARLAAPVSPAAFARGDEYRRVGRRGRVLALPVMVAVVLTVVRRRVPAVSAAVRLLARARRRARPEGLFAGLWAALAPTLPARAAARVRARYPRIWAIDGAPPAELFKRVGLLRDAPRPAPGGTREAARDLATNRPGHLRLDPDPAANGKRSLDRITAALAPGTLPVRDAGYDAFPFFDWLTEHGCGFVVRARARRAETAVGVPHESAHVRDRLARLGAYRSNPCAQPVRLVEVRVGGAWRAYLTNVLDPGALPVTDAVEPYARRWAVEEAFCLTKRLLGPSSLRSGAWNTIALPVWATWLLSGVRVALADAGAEELDRPLDAISLAMVYRGLSHFTGAFQRGEAADPVAYLAAQPDLGIGKRRRRYRERERAALDTWRQELNL